MKKWLIFLFILFIGSAFSLSSDKINSFNLNIREKQIPVSVGSIFGNQKINLYVNGSNGSTILGVETGRDKFVGVSDKFPHPTMNAFVREDVFNDIVSSPNPNDAFLNAVANNKITYQGVGVVNRVKFFFVDLLKGFFIKPQKINTNYYKILYTNNNYNIYLVDYNGSNKVNIATGRYAEWSPDGNKIVYPGLNNLVYLIDADGRNSISIGKGDNPIWSPDGKNIAFSDSLHHSIYIYNLESKQVTNLLNNSDFNGWIDGSRIFYSTMPEGYLSHKRNYYIMSISGNGNISVLNYYDTVPKFSPDRNKIIYPDTGLFEGHGYGIHVKNLITGNDSVLGYGFNLDWYDNDKILYQDYSYNTHLRSISSNSEIVFNGSNIIFSFDGKVAYSRLKPIGNEISTQHIYISNSDSRGEVLLTEGVPRDWSPDGLKLILDRYKNNKTGVYVINRDGTGLFSLGDWGEVVSPEWQPVIKTFE